MSREKELAKNTIILSIGTFLPKFAALVTIPIITSQLTKTEYGTYDLVTTLVSLLLPIVTLQIHSSAFRFLIEYRDNPVEKKRIITNIYVFLIPTSVVALVIFYLFLSDFNLFLRLLVVLYFFLDIILVATQQVVRGLSKNKLYSLSAVIQSFTNAILVVALVGIGKNGLNGVLLSFNIAAFLGTAFLLVKGGIIQEIDFSMRSIELQKKMLNYSWPMIPNTLSGWVLAASDRFVLTAFLGLEALATYAAANKIPLLFTSVQGTFVFAWQENASLALSDADVEKYYSDMFDRIFCILTGIMTLLIGSTPVLFWALIRGDYREAYPQMPILFMGVFFSALSSFMGGIYIAHKRTKNVGITTMLAAACNLAIDLSTVRMIGIFAASVSTLISYVLLAVYRMHDVKRFQPIKYQYGKVTLCLCVLVLMCIVCWFNVLWLNIANFILGCLIAVAINRKLLWGIFRSFTARFGRT